MTEQFHIPPLQMIKEVIFKFLKFGVVGASGVCIDFGITYLLKEKLNIHKLIANSCGFIIAATSNYFFNRVWTFESANQDITGEFGLFFTFSLIGLIINNSVLWLLNEKYYIKFYLAKLIAIGVTFLWNFGSNYLFNF